MATVPFGSRGACLDDLLADDPEKPTGFLVTPEEQVRPFWSWYTSMVFKINAFKPIGDYTTR